LVDVPQDDVVGGGFDYQGVSVEAFDEVVPGVFDDAERRFF